MCRILVTVPPSQKYFDPWDVEHLLYLLESRTPTSPLILNVCYVI